MAMTWNVPVAPGNGSLAVSSHRLMGPKSRPVPLLSVTDSRILNVMRNAGGIGECLNIPAGGGGGGERSSPAGRT